MWRNKLKKEIQELKKTATVSKIHACYRDVQKKTRGGRTKLQWKRNLASFTAPASISELLPRPQTTQPHSKQTLCSLLEKQNRFTPFLFYSPLFFFSFFTTKAVIQLCSFFLALFIRPLIWMYMCTTGRAKNPDLDCAVNREQWLICFCFNFSTNCEMLMGICLLGRWCCHQVI